MHRAYGKPLAFISAHLANCQTVAKRCMCHTIIFKWILNGSTNSCADDSTDKSDNQKLCLSTESLSIYESKSQVPSPTPQASGRLCL